VERASVPIKAKSLFALRPNFSLRFRYGTSPEAQMRVEEQVFMAYSLTLGFSIRFVLAAP
jgi:hypothetical protein